MPLLRIDQLSSHVQLGLWLMAEGETVDLLPISLQDSVSQELSSIKNTVRRHERLAVYALIHAMTGADKFKLMHAPSGQPLLQKHRISISHTKKYVAVLLSTGDEDVALDVEFVSERVHKIVHKFLRHDEVAETTHERLLVWTIKETLYKLFPDDHLLPEEVFVPPFQLHQRGSFSVHNVKRSLNVAIHYEVHPDFILTYTYT